MTSQVDICLNFTHTIARNTKEIVIFTLSFDLLVECDLAPKHPPKLMTVVIRLTTSPSQSVNTKFLSSSQTAILIYLWIRRQMSYIKSHCVGICLCNVLH